MTGDWGGKPAESINKKIFEINDKQREKPTGLINEKPPNPVRTKEKNRS